jgi:phage-related protein (TIGR01555 family)
MFFSKKKEQVQDIAKPLPAVIDWSSMRKPKQARSELIKAVVSNNIGSQPQGTMDALSIGGGLMFGQGISDNHLSWYGNHSFIGYQACAIFAQHWLIDNACSIPVDDAIRKGWELSNSNGESLDDKELLAICKLDKKHNIIKTLREYAKFGRVYGLRVAVFDIETANPDEYYLNPFNIDGITKGSYKGIIHHDPQYMIPGQAGQDPRKKGFYEPEFWVISGRKYHKSHCIIYYHSEVPQMLKPAYMYGGISLTQQIFETVYNAEISANEVPQLLQKMRKYVYKMDLERALLNPQGLQETMLNITELSDNYGIQAIGLEDSMEALTTTLTGLDEVVAGRYKLVASVAQMPVAKLMKTDLTGGLVKGGGEEAIYHETLESLHIKLEPLLDRHYLILCKSELGINDGLTIKFNKLDAMTELEQAQVNLIKAQEREIYSNIGSIDGEDVRDLLKSDDTNSFLGLSDEMPEQQVEEVSTWG